MTQEDYTSPSQSERKSLRQVFNDIRNDVDSFVSCAETFIKEHKQKPQRMVSAEAKEALYDKPTEKVEEHLKRVSRESSFDDDLEDEEYVDRKGQPIRVGSQVIWYDPERSAYLKRVWTVDDLRGEIVYISDEFSEAEVYPHELRVVW